MNYYLYHSFYGQVLKIIRTVKRFKQAKMTLDLLQLVEPVNFINEENRLSIKFLFIFGNFYRFFHVGNVWRGSRESDKAKTWRLSTFVRYDLCQCRLEQLKIIQKSYKSDKQMELMWRRPIMNKPATHNNIVSKTREPQLIGSRVQHSVVINMPDLQSGIPEFESCGINRAIHPLGLISC